MTYSFNVRAADKAAARAAVAAELDKVVEAQPIHAADRAQAAAAADAFLDLIGDPGEGQEVSVSVCGSVSRYGSEALTSASFNVNASILAKTN